MDSPQSDLAKPEIRPADVMEVTVSQCPSCKSHHGTTPVTRYLEERHPWTHYFSCPTTGEPVNVSVVFDEHGKIINLNSDLMQWIVEASRDGVYLASIWHLKNGLPVMRRQTKQFPTAHFQECWRQLQDNLSTEIGPPPQQPMQRAPDPEPVANLFGPPSGD